MLVANGVPHKIIAAMLGISLPTLKAHCRPELTLGFEKVRAAIGMSVVRQAIKGNMIAAKFWLQCRGGADWRVIEGREVGPLEPDERAPPAVFSVAVMPIYAEDGSVIPRPLRRPDDEDDNSR